MAALDTNVLVRFLVDDDPKQAAAARRLLAGAVAAGEPLFVPVTVAIELEWVLRSRYAMPKDEIVATFSRLLSTSELMFESEDALEIALAMHADAAADFSDCLHAALARRAGHAPLWTFDRAAAKVAGARLVAG